jgi:hypothetical protein
MDRRRRVEIGIKAEGDAEAIRFRADADSGIYNTDMPTIPRKGRGITGRLNQSDPPPVRRIENGTGTPSEEKNQHLQII